jgi:hypothetical protein
VFTRCASSSTDCPRPSAQDGGAWAREGKGEREGRDWDGRLEQPRELSNRRKGGPSGPGHRGKCEPVKARGCRCCAGSYWATVPYHPALELIGLMVRSRVQRYSGNPPDSNSPGARQRPTPDLPPAVDGRSVGRPLPRPVPLFLCRPWPAAEITPTLHLNSNNQRFDRRRRRRRWRRWRRRRRGRRQRPAGAEKVLSYPPPRSPTPLRVRTRAIRDSVR